jgi:hypothetical protein
MKSLTSLVWRPFVLLGCLAAFIAAPRVDAQVTLADWQTPGDQLLIVDQTAGLQFLNTRVTAGLSALHVTAQLGPGGDYAGFRYATLTELNATLGRIGVTAVDATGLSTPIAAGELNTFYSYFGLFDQTPYGTSNYGFIDGIEPSYGNRYTVLFAHETYYGYAPRNMLASYQEDFAAEFLGHFLVAPAASAVPEQSTYALLAGFAALCGVFVRRRQKLAQASK